MIPLTVPRERPIIFSSPMVKAILEGRKTMTRRIVKPQPKNLDTYYPCGVHLHEWESHEGVVGGGFGFQTDDHDWKCPYGKVGDRLWCKETWFFEDDRPSIGQDAHVLPENPNVSPEALAMWRKCLQFKADYPTGSPDGTHDTLEPWGKWRSSRFMPKWASRLLREITEVRVERLQSISEEDAVAEGVDALTTEDMMALWCTVGHVMQGIGLTKRGHFAGLWESINDKRPGCSWADNPWVWALTFKVVQA